MDLTTKVSPLSVSFLRRISEIGFSIIVCIARRKNRTPYSTLYPFFKIKFLADLYTIIFISNSERFFINSISCRSIIS